jgi:hypothetical protein
MQDLKSFIKLNLHEEIPWVFITKKLRVACHVQFKKCLLKFRVLTVLVNDTENRKFEQMLALKTDMDEDDDELAGETSFSDQWVRIYKKLCQVCAPKSERDGFFLGFEDYARWTNDERDKVNVCCKHKIPTLPEESFKEDYFKSIVNIQNAFTEEKKKDEDYFFAMQIWSEEHLRYEIELYAQCEKKDDPLICFLYENF